MTALVAQDWAGFTIVGDDKSQSGQWTYFVHDVPDFLTAMSMANAIAPAFGPAPYTSMSRRAPSYSRHGRRSWKVVYPYRPNNETDEAAGIEIDWDIGTTSHKITECLDEIQTYSDGSSIFGAPASGGAIGVTDQGVEGCDILVPNMTLRLAKNIPWDTMGWSTVGLLYDMAGTTNNAPWQIFDTEEVLFAGSKISGKSTDTAKVEFTFHITKTESGLVAGNITGIEKRGWHYLWYRYAQEVDAVAKAIKQTPIAAYVQRVYRTTDFSLFGF